jgi:siroheme synthase (precorrin-2 oxidase/ferrochelatase)
VRLKEKLADWIGPEYAQFLSLAAGIRASVRQSGLSFAERRRIWYRVVDSPALDLLRAGQRNEAERAIARILDEEIAPSPISDSSSVRTTEAGL